ncbi:MAG: transketolase [Candidatus Poribacteria bacterium]|nr:MAG: transketolase [Candidatus Poribacteria bacterium]
MRKTEAPDYRYLAELAREARRHVLKMIHAAGSGHPGGSLSSLDVLVTLYFHEMRHDPKNPDDPDRDRFILSKGHGVPALYTVMAMSGYFDVSLLQTLRKLDSPLQGHPDKRKLPALEASTGSLGQGLSIGIGMALALKLDGRDARVYVMLGDGECDEGQVWEAAMFAGNRGAQLNNLCAIVDANGAQLDGYTKDIMPLEPFADKWRAFNWNVLEIDGHSYPEIVEAFQKARACKTAPTVIIARTVKGKGVSFMEAAGAKYHGVAPTDEELERALAELEAE